jgi:predicted tellurium resistance membrane protein TerC
MEDKKFNAYEFLGVLCICCLGMFGLMPILMGVEHSDIPSLIVGIVFSVAFIGLSAYYFKKSKKENEINEQKGK